MSAIRFCFLVSLSLAITRGFDYYGQTTYCPTGGVPVCATNGMQTQYFANQCQMDLLNMKMQIPFIATSLSNCMSYGRQVNAYASAGFSPVRQPAYARYPSYGGYSTYPTTASTSTESTTSSTESTTTELTTTSPQSSTESTTAATTDNTSTQELILNMVFPNGWSFNMTILAPLSTSSTICPNATLSLTTPTQTIFNITNCLIVENGC